VWSQEDQASEALDYRVKFIRGDDCREVEEKKISNQIAPAPSNIEEVWEVSKKFVGKRLGR